MSKKIVVAGGSGQLRPMIFGNYLNSATRPEISKSLQGNNTLCPFGFEMTGLPRQSRDDGSFTSW